MFLLPLTMCVIRRYYCTFHVQEYSKNSAAEIKTFIYAALMSEYKNGSITVKTMDVAIKHISKLALLTQIKGEKDMFSYGIQFGNMYVFFFSATKLFRRNYSNNIWTIYLAWSISTSQPRNGMQKAKIS